MTTSMIRIVAAAILLAVATCCGGPEASAQLFLNFGQPAQRSPGITDNLGLGGPGSATQMQGLNEPVIGSSRGLGLPLLDPQAGKPLGVNGNPVGTAQGSLSSAGDRSSSPADSITNTLTGSVGILASPPPKSAVKRKQTNNAAATSSSSRGAAPQVSSAKTP